MDNSELLYVPSSPDLVQLERDRIDARIVDLELELVKLKRRRNALSAVSQLSAEVLLNIFEYIQYNSEDEAFDIAFPIRRAL